MSTKLARPHVIVVAKRSQLARLHEGLLDARAQRLIRTGHEAVKKWIPAHDEHERTLETVMQKLERLGANVLLLRGASAAFDPAGTELIVTVGGDGTLLAASHSIADLPVLGVNSAPRYSVGFFCAAKPRTVGRMLARALEGNLPHMELARMQVTVGGQVRAKRVLNEALFCHKQPAATSSYVLKVGRKREEQKSSGLWIGPAAGSTAALLSAGAKVLPLTSTDLQYIVREPYIGDGRLYRLVYGKLTSRQELVLVSKMDQGAVYLDGPYRVLPVKLGEDVRFSLSDEPLRVLGLSERARFAGRKPPKR
ncbi:MAG: hypothetical protein B6A08_13730 [Sorangiineae bacterium NIC37A_2]|jgi:NAD+ kinase|nr:MAG: hypothetical protein B6A08_13730 [Sorangiineae bacterium NIC37A_2]